MKNTPSRMKNQPFLLSSCDRGLERKKRTFHYTRGGRENTEKSESPPKGESCRYFFYCITNNHVIEEVGEQIHPSDFTNCRRKTCPKTRENAGITNFSRYICRRGRQIANFALKGREFLKIFPGEQPPDPH